MTAVLARMLKVKRTIRIMMIILLCCAANRIESHLAVCFTQMGVNVLMQLMSICHCNSRLQKYHQRQEKKPRF